MRHQVIVLGATGRVGAVTVGLALADGFDVVAVARNPAKIDRRHDRLTVVQGDTTDPAGLPQALAAATGHPDRAGGGDVDSSPAVVMAVGADPLKPSTLVGDTLANSSRSCHR